MSDERVPVSPQSLWQGQPAPGGAMSLDELHGGSRRLARLVRRRNLVEFVAAVFVVIAVGWAMWSETMPMLRVAGGLMIAGTIVVVYHLHRHGTAQAIPADAAATSCLAFHRAELERQRDLLRSVWKWYLLPFAPGLILIDVGSALAHPERAFRSAWGAIAALVLALVISELNRYGAKRLQSRIDALERSS